MDVETYSLISFSQTVIKFPHKSTQIQSKSCTELCRYLSRHGTSGQKNTFHIGSVVKGASQLSLRHLQNQLLGEHTASNLVRQFWPLPSMLLNHSQRKLISAAQEGSVFASLLPLHIEAVRLSISAKFI